MFFKFVKPVAKMAVVNHLPTVVRLAAVEVLVRAMVAADPAPYIAKHSSSTDSS